jgi:hypothetical protein
MTTYLELLNKARQRQGSLPISLLSIGDNSGDSLKGIAAVRKALDVFYRNSFSLDATEVIYTTPLVIGVNTIPEPTEKWDSNVIKGVKFLKDDKLKPLTLVTAEEAETLKLLPLATNDPTYWYVENMELKVLPTPTEPYIIKVFYQKLFPDINSESMSNVVMLPRDALNTLEDGIYAWLRVGMGDPLGFQYQGEFERSVSIYYERNKHTYKRKGFKRFRVVTRRGDRSL